MTVASSHTGPWTLASVLSLPDAGTHTRHELIDGMLLVTPAPSYPHQRAARRLAKILEQAAVAGRYDVEIFETVNVETSSGLLIPDIAVVQAQAARNATITLPAASVLAVVEIVSPSTRRVDRLLKPGVYAESGIPVFWRVDLEPTPTVAAFTLGPDGQYAPSATAHGHVPAAFATPYPVTLTAADLTSMNVC